MEYNESKKVVTIFGKNEKLDTLANRLSNLSGDQVYSMFSNRGIAVPRRLNCLALYSVINQRLKNIHASELSKDYFYRLKYYKEFSESQLINLFSLICKTNEEFKLYRVNLFKLIIINYVGLNLNDGEIKYLKDLRKLSVESFDVYSSFISAMCHEQTNTFDGQDFKVLEDCLINSATSSEIVSLALKYGLNVPTKLKKNEIVDNIYEYYDKQGKLTIELKNEIENKNIAELNAFCKSKKLPFSSSMTKTEMVYYLFYNLSNCEIVTTSMNRIEAPDEFLPLDITIDMQAFKGFNACDDRRIVLYPGCDDDEFEALFNDTLDDYVKTSEATLDNDEEADFEAIDENITSLETNDNVISDASVNEEAFDASYDIDIVHNDENEPINVENNIEVENNIGENTFDLKQNDIQEEANSEASNEDTKNVYDSFGLENVIENDHFGDDSIYKYLDSPLKIVWIILGVVGLLALIGLIIWFLVM